VVWSVVGLSHAHDHRLTLPVLVVPQLVSGNPLTHLRKKHAWDTQDERAKAVPPPRTTTHDAGMPWQQRLWHWNTHGGGRGHACMAETEASGETIPSSKQSSILEHMRLDAPCISQMRQVSHGGQ